MSSQESPETVPMYFEEEAGFDEEEEEHEDQCRSTISVSCVANTIYVRNIDYKGKPEDIAESFKKFGAVKDVRIATATYRGKVLPLGYCFVEFKEHEGQENALKGVKEQPITLDGRVLKVWPARERNQKDEE